MPKPTGWSEAMLRARDRCVEHLLQEGVPEPTTAEQREQTPRERAFAICTASVKSTRESSQVRGHAE